MYFCLNEFEVSVNDSIFSGNEQQKVISNGSQTNCGCFFYPNVVSHPILADLTPSNIYLANCKNTWQKYELGKNTLPHSAVVYTVVNDVAVTSL